MSLVLTWREAGRGRMTAATMISRMSDWLYLGIERHMPAGLMKEIARQAAGDTTRDVPRVLGVSRVR